MSLLVPPKLKYVSTLDSLEPISNIYNNLKNNKNKKTWKTKSENELWSDLCFCILSSNVIYEQATSATTHLSEKNYLNTGWILEEKNAFKIISGELSKSLFYPNKKDGTLRKYRFPNVRAKNIVDSAHFLYGEFGSIKKIFTHFNSEIKTRDFLVQNISGLGLKEASHFLRNIGFSSKLAIIDVHIISFLKELEIINVKLPITPKQYFEMETKMNDLVNFLGYDLSLFDNAVWNYMRIKNQL